MKKPTPLASGAKKKRILIIEDERPLAHAMELKLNHDGFETTVALNGADGLKKALTGDYHLILLDLILPEVDGFTILQELRSKKMKTPVVVLSNLAQLEDQTKAKELGAKEYLVKANVPLADIVTMVQQFL
jgi:DNA-binding response OmpR family regulator